MSKILQLYKKSLAERDQWSNRWAQCRRYTMPKDDADMAALFDSTAGDAAEIYFCNIENGEEAYRLIPHLAKSNERA